MKARTSEYPICRHTKTNGLLCQSPASGPSAYCHFHKKRARTRVPNVGSGPALREHILYPLRDADSIRQALSMVLSGLANGRIPTGQAGKMLFALQIATTDLRKPIRNHEFSCKPFRWGTLQRQAQANPHKANHFTPQIYPGGRGTSDPTPFASQALLDQGNSSVIPWKL